MAQSSGPIAQGTDAERQFTDVLWRDLFGDEPGVIGDMDGSAYALSLPSGSDIVSVGSTTQASVARLAGFAHRIPASSPETLSIPAASGSARTDIIALRYDPAFTGAPGPVRLTRIAGTSSLLPAYDSAPPGVEDLPLWAITRNVGQNLSQATVKQLFPRLAPTLEIPVGAPLPVNSPLGTTAWQGNTQYRRTLGGASTPVWSGTAASTDISFTAFVNANGWTARSTTTSGYEVVNRWAMVNVNFSRSSWAAGQLIFTLPEGVRPSRTRYFLGQWSSGVKTEIRIDPNGQIIATDAGTSGIVLSLSFPVA